MVYLPKDEGGLWVLDFKKQNESLLMHKFYNRLDVKLIWQKYYSSGQLQVSISGGGTYLSCYPPSKAQILKHPSQIIRFLFSIILHLDAAWALPVQAQPMPNQTQAKLIASRIPFVQIPLIAFPRVVVR